MKYTPLRISTVRPNRRIDFDIYIHFKNTFLCYIKKGEELNSDHIKKLRTQNITKFFITEHDELSYQKFLDSLIDEIMNSSCKIEEKVTVIGGTVNTATERIQNNPECKNSYNMTKKAAINLRQMIHKNPESLAVFFNDQREDAKNPLIRHSFNLSILSMKLAEQEGLSNDEQDIIATAALIHDVGIGLLPENIRVLANKERDLLTNVELNILSTHGELGANIFSNKEYINEEIIALIRNHEEVIGGDGPLRKKVLTKKEQIISAADCFDRHITLYNKTLEETALIMNKKAGHYNHKYIKGIDRLVKHEKLYEKQSYGSIVILP